jgi:hypothetical protein
VTWRHRFRLILRLYGRLLSGKMPLADLEAEVRQVRRGIGRDCEICGRSKPFGGPCGYCPPEWQRGVS